MRPLILALTGLAVASSLIAQTSAAVPAASTSGSHAGRPVPVSRAVRASAPIHVDGSLDEAAWAATAVVSEFTQVDPQEGQPVSQKTEARVLYDDHALYVGVRLHDTGKVVGRLGRRDMPLGDSDWFGVMIDSYHDHRTAFGFDVNPAGVQRDEVKTSRGAAGDVDDNTWDAVWDVATTVDEGGWTAEYRIPFSQLRFDASREQLWGVVFERVIGRNREYATSSFSPKSERGGIAQYGHLEGLRDIRPGKRLEALPYTLARSEYVNPGQNPFRSASEYGYATGLDLLYRVTSDLTLNASFNPDFGQVEVDPAVVNLGVYETFFQEKRPLFVEGSEIFGFSSGGGGQLFYSRRIGRAPQLFAPSPAAEAPSATTILGAAKLSGKTGGWSLGMLNATTGREEAHYLDPQGGTRSLEVEPLTNYFVGRARRELNGGRTQVGGMVTATNRDLATEAQQLALRSEAYAAGLDFRHEWSNRAWVLEASVVGSAVRGERHAITGVQRLSNHFFQRPDATHLEVDTLATSLEGVSAQLSLAKQAGQHWRTGLQLATTTPGYEVNDLGFSYRTDRRDFQAVATYLENKPGKFWRNYNITGTTRWEGNYVNQRIANWNRLFASFRHLDFWSLYLSTNYSLRANDDRTTRGGPIMVRPAAWNLGGTWVSDGRKPVTFQLQSGYAGDEFGLRAWELNAAIGIKTSSRWNLSLGPGYLRNHVSEQYVTTVIDPEAQATYGRRYIFAELDQTQLALVTRFNWTFTPRLSLETYVQPLISTGDYGAPKQLVAPRTYEFQPYGGTVPNRDFNLRSLRGNAVLRWEWRPGSTLYLAWQQTRQDIGRTGDFDFGRDGRALFEAEPDDILLFKINYWFNP